MPSSTTLLSDVSEDCVARSQLLRDLVATASDAEVATVPLSDDAFLLWMQHVRVAAKRPANLSSEYIHGTGNRTDFRSRAPSLSTHLSSTNALRLSDRLSTWTHLPSHAFNAWTALASLRLVWLRAAQANLLPRSVPRSVPRSMPRSCRHDSLASAASIAAMGNAERLCEVIMAADVLIDDATKHSASAGLATLLQHHSDSDSGHSELADKVMTLLSEDLLRAVISRIPLDHILRHLPPNFHALALTNHGPHHRHLLPESVPAALAASATLPGLRDLSFAGTTFSHACCPCFSRLLQLTCLTALSVADTGLSDEAAAALAGVLPALPLLRSLDLSSNDVTADAAAALRSALCCCSALLSLDMSNWRVPESLCTRSGSWFTLGEVERHAVHAVTALRQLTALSFGIAPHQGLRVPDTLEDELAGTVLHLLEALSSMRGLMRLELCCPWLHVPHTQAARMAELLSEVPSLPHLNLLVPRNVSSHLGHEFLHFAGIPICSSHGVTVGRAHGHCAHLSSLELRLPDPVAGVRIRGPFHGRIIGQIASQTDLRQLRVAASGLAIAEDGVLALADLLPHLPRLTQLHLNRLSRYLGGSSRQLAEAAAAALQLRELRLPLCEHSSDAVNPLLRSTHLRCLQLDLILDFRFRGHHHALDEVQRRCMAFVPLLPHVTHLNMRMRSYRGEFCVLAAADKSLCGLTALGVEIREDTATTSDLQQLLDCIPHLTGLQQLELSCVAKSTPHAGGHDHEVLLDAGPFCAGLRGLSSLTSLEWGVHGTDRRVSFLPEMLHACVDLTGLAALELRQPLLMLASEDLEAFAAFVPQLPLRQLTLMILMAHEKVLSDVVRQLPHLRALMVVTGYRPGQQIVQPLDMLNAAVKSLPACHLRRSLIQDTVYEW